MNIERGPFRRLLPTLLMSAALLLTIALGARWIAVAFAAVTLVTWFAQCMEWWYRGEVYRLDPDFDKRAYDLT